MSLTAVVTLLQTALSLVLAVHSVPNVPQSLIDTANAAAQQAIQQANAALTQPQAAGTAVPQGTLSTSSSVLPTSNLPTQISSDVWSAFGTVPGTAPGSFGGIYTYSPTADTLLQALQSPTPQASAGTPSAADPSTPCRAANGSSFSAGSTVGACLVSGSGAATCAGSTQYMCIGGEWTAQ
jgi:hypothetical protein